MFAATSQLNAQTTDNWVYTPFCAIQSNTPDFNITIEISSSWICKKSSDIIQNSYTKEFRKKKKRHFR